MWFAGFLGGCAVGLVVGIVFGGLVVLGAWAATDHMRADLDSMDCPRAAQPMEGE